MANFHVEEVSLCVLREPELGRHETILRRTLMYYWE